MAYTVKQVAKMSGVSVRTLRFYDETDLLKPAYHGNNGYRFYEEQQLLQLQQILFYRELGFELKQIKAILDRADFEKVTALESHKEVLLQSVRRTLRLIDTIDNTIAHLKGVRKMQAEELFAGFHVAAGADRFGEPITLGSPDSPSHCKVSARDTNGAMCIFEFAGGGGGPRHLHHEQDEWVYVLEGACWFEVGGERVRLTAGESIFLPRKTPHAWTCEQGSFCKIINAYQPAGTMEAFFRDVSRSENLPTREDVMSNTYTQAQIQEVHRLFEAHGMDVTGPPRIIE